MPPSGTFFNPIRVDEFEKTKLNFDGQGMSATVTAGSTQNVDLLLSDDVLLTGCWFITNNSNLGDTLTFQVVDTSGAFTGTPGTVLSQFITNWYPNVSTDINFEVPYPAKIPAGLTLRLVYVSTGSTNPFVAANYQLHKVLV